MAFFFCWYHLPRVCSQEQRCTTKKILIWRWTIFLQILWCGEMISMNLDVYHFYALALRNSTLVSPRRTRKLADAGPIESLGASLSLSLSLWKSWGSSSLPLEPPLSPAAQCMFQGAEEIRWHARASRIKRVLFWGRTLCSSVAFPLSR